MEVVSTIGNAFLSSFVEGMLEKLSSIMDWNKYAFEDNISEEINNWKKQLKKIYAELDDADEKQWGNQLVKMWVCDLRDLAYDVEDVLDELATEADQRKLEAALEARARPSKVRKIISTVKFSADLASKVESISARFHEVFKVKDSLNLGGASHVTSRARLPATSMLEVNELKIYGREKDKEKLLELLKDEASDVNVSVIPIIGMGGIGKTTLAQFVFNDPVLEFDFNSWVSVGEDFDVARIIETILRLNGGDDEDLNSLQMKLKEKLHREKCLVVLDDVWTERYDHWTCFYSPFREATPGSKIIITTRNESVALMMVAVSVYTLKELSTDDCLAVFVEHALGKSNFDEHLHLEEMNPSVWKQLLNNNMWDVPDDKCNILPALRLSYFHLPFYLKQCFAYCASFPKDFEFNKMEVVLLWMAEGFVNQPEEMLELGCQYFDDLLSRSFFQVSSSHESRYVMHDLIHDLAQSVSGDTCFHLGDKQKNKDILHAKIRYSSFDSCRFDTWQKFKDFSPMKNLQAFLALPIMELSDRQWHNYLTNKVLHDMVLKLRSLRVLSLAGYHIVELPSSIGTLKRLRYLNLSYTEIQRLPESAVELLNLQTLILRSCSKLTELPTRINNLINLQCKMNRN